MAKELTGSTKTMADELRAKGNVTVGPGSNGYHVAKENRSVFNLYKRKDGGYTISLKSAYR